LTPPSYARRHQHHQPTPPPPLIDLVTEIPKIRLGGGRGRQDSVERQPTQSQWGREGEWGAKIQSG
jgi:hypothetical protein